MAIDAKTRSIVCYVNDTPERRAQMARLRADGHDVVHIPPPPPWSDWEQYSRVFGHDSKVLRAYIEQILRAMGRDDIIATFKQAIK